MSIMGLRDASASKYVKMFFCSMWSVGNRPLSVVCPEAEGGKHRGTRQPPRRAGQWLIRRQRAQSQTGRR